MNRFAKFTLMVGLLYIFCGGLLTTFSNHSVAQETEKSKKILKKETKSLLEKKLEAIPVCVLVDNYGNYIPSPSSKSNKMFSFYNFYFSAQKLADDYHSYLADPQLGKNGVNIKVMNLSSLYKEIVKVEEIKDKYGKPIKLEGKAFALKNGKDKDEKLPFASLEVDKEDLREALNILFIENYENYKSDARDNRPRDYYLLLTPKDVIIKEAIEAVLLSYLTQVEAEKFGADIPLFYIVYGANQNRYREPSDNLTPFYFSYKEANQKLSVLRQKDPKTAKTARLKIIGLFQIVEEMSKSEVAAKEYLLIPPRSILDFLQDLKNGKSKYKMYPST